MATVLRCSDYRCINTNVNAYRDDRSYEDRQEKRPLVASLSNILCNKHAGGQRRSRYQSDPIPLTDEDRERLLAEQAVVDEQEREAQRQRSIESDQRDAQRHAEAWALMDVPAHHSVTEEKDDWRAERDIPEPIFHGKVWVGDDPGDRYDNRWFQLEPTQRLYGGKGRLYPYSVRVTRGANLSPNEARALAAALIEGADKVEELNATRKPKS